MNRTSKFPFPFGPNSIFVTKYGASKQLSFFYDTVISNVQFVDSFGRSRFYPTTTPAR